MWKNDAELFALMKSSLYTAVVGDIMDKHGLLHQFLPPILKPLRDDMIIAGRAMPVLEADIFGEAEKPFGLMLEALDDLREDEVYICTGSSPRYALWGELMSTRARHLGAAGAVVNGYARDTRGILALDFPTFAYGSYAQDQGPRGKVIDYRVPIEIDGVLIRPGDIVFGDIGGVLIIPAAHEADVLAEAMEKMRGEKTVGKAIEAGMSTCEAFKKYGIM